MITSLKSFACSQARESARRSVCLSNLKQIGPALRMYSNVYEENFPNNDGRTGLELLASSGFLENTEVYECPSTTDNVANSISISISSSYCYARGLSEASSVDSAIAEDRSSNHEKYGNLLFVDGHVKGYAGSSWSANRGDSVLTEF